MYSNLFPSSKSTWKKTICFGRKLKRISRDRQLTSSRAATVDSLLPRCYIMGGLLNIAQYQWRRRWESGAQGQRAATLGHMLSETCPSLVVRYIKGPISHRPSVSASAVGGASQLLTDLLRNLSILHSKIIAKVDEGLKHLRCLDAW